MYRPYTDNFPEAVAIAGQCVGAALTAVIWSRPLRTRAATILFGTSVAIAALCPMVITNVLRLDPNPSIVPILQASATMATIAAMLQGPRWFGVFAALGQCALFGLAQHVRDSNYELCLVHLFWYGIVAGVHALHTVPPRQTSPRIVSGSFRRQDAVIFLGTVALALVITNLVFARLIYNGDEVANSFQADVYGHLRARADIPPCASMFENYWVFRHRGYAFSQYTPGWPLFMAVFQRLGVIWLAGPVMAGILAVGIARLSRRVASGLGPTLESSERIVATAGVLGAALAFLGPALLLNGGSRFSHTMVCACFAWSVESLCVISDRDVSRQSAWRYGLLLGASTALGLATRPADGGMLGVGIFFYFLSVLFRRRLTWRAFVGTAIGFLFFGGLTLIILRLQLGAWFQTGYAINASIHSEAELRFSWPRPNDLKSALPIASGSYCWWPVAPALGIMGLIRALGGRERRVPFMLVISALTLTGFYFMVEFGRWADDGLGPRYFLPLVVCMAAGTAAVLAPLVEAMRQRRIGLQARIKAAVPAILTGIAVVYGVARIAPMVYPLAYAEYRYATTPFRAAKKMGLKNAIVMIEPGASTAHETNLAQNAPMDPNPSVLFLIRRSAADEACAREHFPGRTWYRAGTTETLTPY